MKTQSLRAIPSVEKLLQSLGDAGVPRPAVIAIVRRELATFRKKGVVPEFDTVLGELRGKLAGFRHSRLQPLINGTGILVHTNLGRSPLGPEVQETLRELFIGNFSNQPHFLRRIGGTLVIELRDAQLRPAHFGHLTI